MSASFTPCPMMGYGSKEIGIGSGNGCGYVKPVFWVTPKGYDDLRRRSDARLGAVAKRLQELMLSDPELQRLFAEEWADRRELREADRRRHELLTTAWTGVRA